MRLDASRPARKVRAGGGRAMNDGFSVFSDLVCELGEGPGFDARRGTLYWFDIKGRRLIEKRPDRPGTIVHDLPFMASALATIDGGRHLIAAEDGLYLRDAATGALALHTPLEADNAVTRSNDARVHPSGAFWIGTMGQSAEARAGSIWWFREGQLKRLFGEITIPNSICFSADGSTAFYADSVRATMWRVDCDPATGLPAGDAKVFLDQRGEKGAIDGSVIDADGLIWNARWGASALDAYDPDGRRVKRIATPATQPTCPAFIDADAGRLVVTSAWEGKDADARTADPLAGQTFLLDGPVRGRREPDVVI